jgi:hypothetical protein
MPGNVPAECTIMPVTVKVTRPPIIHLAAAGISCAEEEDTPFTVSA